jgi:hypothetical protein
MLFRMENIDGELVVHNVEADLPLATVDTFYTDHPDDPNREVFACSVFNNAGERLATISTVRIPNPLEKASVVVANYLSVAGYSEFKSAKKLPEPCRIEWRLGEILTDAVSTVARAWIEQQSGKLKAETKDKFADLIVQLYRIWFASRFGSFDGGRRKRDQYFHRPPPGPSRMGFAEAAQF